MFTPRFSALVGIVTLFLVTANRGQCADPAPQNRPNILWLVCEDSNVSWFGCYGNTHARTPNIDALAKQGFRYTHAYACAPVCAPSRSTWITGVYAVSTGTLPMRSRYPIPHDQIAYYPDLLRKAGYFTVNGSKTDYNIGGRGDDVCWDAKGPNAWKRTPAGKPFFQIINFNSSHESSAHGDVTRTKHSPQDVQLAKYHPDELGIRQTYAKYHDAVAKMDAEVGQALADLEKSGLAENTIVIFNSDHGGVMPRSKRFLYNSGVHAPLIVRIPEKYKQWWPASKPGSTVDRLVSFIDMPKTWLKLAGATVPPIMQGRVFFGPSPDTEPEFVFSFRDRMDERFDCQRAIRNKQFVYIRNEMPAVPNGQHLEYLWKMQATRTWEDAYRNKRTNAITGRFFEPKPVEELYDTQADPDNVVNLAANPAHQQTLATMRTKLREWRLAVHDSGLLPEAERFVRAQKNTTTIYQMVQDPKLYNLAAYLDASDVALSSNLADTKRLIEWTTHADSGLRYWGVMGLLHRGQTDAATVAALEAALNDSCGDVVATASWALLRIGQTAKGQAALLKLIQTKSPATLLALNIIDWTKTDATPYKAAMTALPTKGHPLAEYEQRMIAYFDEQAAKPKK